MTSNLFHTLLRGAALGVALTALCSAQEFDLLLKGGHVVDGKNKLSAVRDVGIKDGKIALVAPSIEAARALKAVDVAGLYVAPGLIDIHVHVYAGAAKGELAGGLSSLIPDQGVRRKSDLNQIGPNRLKRGARHKSNEGISMEDAIPGLHKNS